MQRHRSNEGASIGPTTWRKLFKHWKIDLTPRVLAYTRFHAPFIVETDESAHAVGTLLAQKQDDRKIHLIQFTSGTMTAAERRHSACEREALAVIFALKKFRLFLKLTGPLKLITDHRGRLQ